MRNFKYTVPMFSIMVFLIAGIAGANMTERLEGKYLKSRVKMRIDEGWKVISSNVSGPRLRIFTETGWTTTNVPHDMRHGPGRSGGQRK